MENNNVSQEIWDAKEKRIVKQSCLKCAVEIAIALWQHPQVKWSETPDESKIAKGICTFADLLVNWVYEKDTIQQIPTPTLQQKQVLENLATATNLDYNFVIQKIWEKKKSLVIENYANALAFLKGIKNNE